MKALLFTALTLVAGGMAVPAATLERLSLDDMITKSTAIVRGKVVDSFAVASGPVIYTHYRVQVSETLKGAARNSVEILLPGGISNNLRQSFAGVPQFNAGDEFVFFLWSGRSGNLQVLGLTQGLFAVATGGAADPVMTRSASHEMMLEHGTGKQIQDQAVTMRLSALRARIGQTFAGVRGASK